MDKSTQLTAHDIGVTGSSSPSLSESGGPTTFHVILERIKSGLEGVKFFATHSPLSIYRMAIGNGKNHPRSFP